MSAYSNQTSDFPAARDIAGQTAPSVGGWLRRLNPVRRLAGWLGRQQTVTELYGLDDRSLADLGITRGDFPAILSGSYRRGE